MYLVWNLVSSAGSDGYISSCMARFMHLPQGHWQTIEDIAELLPKLDVVAAFALIVEASL